jgi:hypothetical protein
MVPIIKFAPLHFILDLIKRVQLHMLPALHVFSFAIASTFGKSSINSELSAGLRRSFYRAPKADS